MSFLKNKKDTKEIVIFFKKDSKCDFGAVAKEIRSRYPNLGEPKFMGEKAQIGLPILYFGEDHDMVISVDNFTISIVTHDKYFSSLATIVFDIVDAFEENGSEFTRMGYVSNIFLESKDIDIVKERFLNTKELDGVIDINIGWYRVLDAKFGKINCWEKFITEKSEVDNLICQYDFNTPADQKFVFEMKGIKEFLRVSDDYIESRIKSL